MENLGIIDRFMTTFITYIESGFGLLSGDVAFLTTTLVGIDITLAGLFWAMGGEDDVVARLLKKILYVGAFALILGNFSSLADIIFRSFAGLGITAGGGSMGADDLLRPGFVANTGYEAAWPLLDQASELIGFTTFFENFLAIAVLLLAWFLVVAAFFILSIQLFVTIIEFKLTALAGFVLVPFALWSRTGFLAERVLGNVVTSGIKVMVLAVIVGIGSGFFNEFVGALDGKDADVAEALSLVLASLSLLGLGIFGPSIANGLVGGGPQLGAGAALATVAAGAGSFVVSGAALAGSARALAGGALSAARAGTALGPAAAARIGLGTGLSGEPRVPGSAAGSRHAGEHGRGSAQLESSADAVPAWARQLGAQQAVRHHGHLAFQSLRAGDSGGAGIHPDLGDKEG